MDKYPDSSSTEVLIDWAFIDVATLVEHWHICKIREEGLVFNNIIEAQIAVELCLNYNQAIANQETNKH